MLYTQLHYLLTHTMPVTVLKQTSHFKHNIFLLGMQFLIFIQFKQIQHMMLQLQLLLFDDTAAGLLV